MKRLATVVSILVLLVSVPVFACGAKAGAECPMMMKGVEKSAQNLADGVKITIAAKDAGQVKALQTAMAAEVNGDGCGGDCIAHKKGVKRAVENTANGVVLMLTSADKDQVKAIQTYAAEGCGGKGECPHAKGAAAAEGKGECPHMKGAAAKGDRT